MQAGLRAGEIYVTDHLHTLILGAKGNRDAEEVHARGRIDR